MFASKTHEITATLAALDRSHAVIEFEMDGTIVSANENFLAVTGYRLADIRGRSHAIFVAAKERHSMAGRVPGRRVPPYRQARPGCLDPGDLQSDPAAKRQAVQGHRFRHRYHRAHQARRRGRCVPPRARIACARPGRCVRCVGPDAASGRLEDRGSARPVRFDRQAQKPWYGRSHRRSHARGVGTRPSDRQCDRHDQPHRRREQSGGAAGDHRGCAPRRCHDCGPASALPGAAARQGGLDRHTLRCHRPA
jgi:hypothetical protein